MNTNQQLIPSKLDRPLWSLALAVVSAGLLWLMLLRATDTGSLQQYGVALILLIFLISRVGNIFKKGRKR